jgi:hypothetical protein
LHDPVASPGAADDRVLAAWESPEAVEIDLGQAKTADTNSNFDGSNDSS